MNAAEHASAEQLFVILVGRLPTDSERESLFDRCDDRAAFRLKLLTNEVAGPHAAEVVSLWRQGIRRRIEHPSASELLFAIERAAAEHMDARTELKEIDQKLLSEFQALDTLSTDMGDLAKQVSACRTALAQLRRAVLVDRPDTNSAT